MECHLGLVLSGGGARGVAHAGVLKALTEHGIRPDCIAGSSSGALVGALYAAGYSPEEMLQFFDAGRNRGSPFVSAQQQITQPETSVDGRETINLSRDAPQRAQQSYTAAPPGPQRLFEQFPVLGSL